MSILDYCIERVKINETDLFNRYDIGDDSRRCYSSVKLSGDLLIVKPDSNILTGFGVNGVSRGEIKSFSLSSAARMSRYLREAESEYRVFITLTYPPGHGMDGRRAKRDLNIFAKRFSRLVQNDQDKWSMFWFMEFQKSGRIHFHCFSTHRICHKKLARVWFEICDTGVDAHLRAGTSVEKLKAGRAGAISYARKYARKSVQKIVPKNIDWSGRFWGVYGVRKCVSATIHITAKKVINKHFYNKLALLSDVVSKHAASGGIKKIETLNNPCILYAIRSREAASEVSKAIESLKITEILYGLVPKEIECQVENDFETADFNNDWVEWLGKCGGRLREKMLLQAE